MKKIAVFSFLLLLSLFWGCKEEVLQFDASGSFEADEKIISAEATGKIIQLAIEEGQQLQDSQLIGQVDVSLLNLQLAQMQAAVKAINQKTNTAQPQIGILQAQLQVQEDQQTAVSEQINILDKEIKRFGNLVTANAAPQKQLDDLRGQKTVLEKQLEAAMAQKLVIQAQIKAASTNVNVQNRAILSEVEPALKRIAVLEKQIKDGTIINQYAGTVLTQYAKEGEFTSIGKPLYKIADLSVITLRAYITGDQLPKVRLSQKVTVLTDDGSGGFDEVEGTITWISSQAEFTPKAIQTKSERANQVYAIKVKIPNDGRYKIGMYGEVKFL